IVQGRFDMPNPLEFPRMGSAVIPLMGCERLTSFCRSIVNEFVALAFGKTFWCCGRFAWLRSRLFPGFAAVVRALNDLAEPTTGLRNIKAIRIHWRSFRVINFPAGEMWAADLPLFAFAVRGQNERSLLCANQQSYLAH